MIVGFLVAQRQTVASLREHFGERVSTVARVAPIRESVCQRARQSQAVIHLAQEQGAAVAGEMAAGKTGDDRAGAELLKEQRLVVTVCLRKGGAGCFQGVQCLQAF